MATPGAKIQFSGLARKLVHDGLISDAQAQEAFEAATRNKVPFVTYLVDKKIAGSRQIAQSAAEEFGVPLLDIDAVELDPDVVKLVKDDLVRKHHSLPLYKRGNRLFIAVFGPKSRRQLADASLNLESLTFQILGKPFSRPALLESNLRIGMYFSAQVSKRLVTIVNFFRNCCF